MQIVFYSMTIKYNIGGGSSIIKKLIKHSLGNGDEAFNSYFKFSLQVPI